MKELIKKNPILHGQLVINKLNNRAKEIKDPAILSLLEETKIVIQELLELNIELENILAEDCPINKIGQI